MLNFLNLYLGKFSGDTTEEQNQKIKALDSAKNILLHQLGLPYSERIYTFSFFENQEIYPLPFDFIAPISLHYDESQFPVYKNLNEQVEFIYEYPEKIISKPKISDVVYWSIDLFSPTQTSNWRESIRIKAIPRNRSIIINDCEDLNGWSVSNDATELSVDNLRYKTSGSSLKFKIDKALSSNQMATITYNSSSLFDFSTYILTGVFSFDLFIPYIQGISNIIFKWGQNSSNFYFYINNKNADATLYNNDWNKFLVYWQFANTVGSPTPNNVSFFEIEINYNESNFISPQYFNLDSIYLLNPDVFSLRYYSSYVVEASSGQLKSSFSDTTDTALYAVADPTLGDLTAKIASYIYAPTNNRDFSGAVSVIKSISFDLIEPYLLKYPPKTPQYYRGVFESPKLRYL